MAAPQVGSQFAGYRIESLLGRGGMGVVYRARQPDLDRTVALKLIAPEALEDAAARERFVSEARHAAAIEHPNVVPIYAAGESDGVAYFVMRLVEGDDLRTRVRRDGALAPAKAAQIADSVGAALDAIHRAGLVHRDVKPANILLAAGDHVYLTDFGLARHTPARAGSTTGRGGWAGSLHYAAPEQIRGGRIDARADVYALGGVLFFMLTGRVPFDRDSDEATLWAHVAEAPPRPSAVRRGLSKALDEVVVRAMAKDPNERYASAGDLGRAALAAAQGRRAPRRRGVVAQGAASPSGALAVPGLSDEAPTLTSLTAGVPPVRRARRARLGGAAAAVLAAGIALGLALHGGGGHPAAAHAPTPTPTPRATQTPAPTPSPTPTVSGAHVAATFHRVSHRPNAIVRVGRELWVTSANRPLTRLDAMTGRHRTRDPRVGPGGKAMSARGHRVWVTNRYTRDVTAFAAAPPHRLLARFVVPGLPVDVAADRGGGVWVALRGESPDSAATVLHYDAAGRELAQYPFPDGVTSVTLALGSLWVAELRRPKVMRIDLRTGRKRLGGQLIFAAGALAAGGGYVWAAMPDHDAVSRIRPGQSRDPTFQAAGKRPEDLTYSHGRVYIASRFDDTLVVLDAKTMKPVRKPLSLPLNPFAVTSDRRHVWVAGLGDDTISRVDLG